MGRSYRKKGRRNTNRRQGQQGGAGAAEFVANAVGGTVNQQIANSLQGGDNVIKPLTQQGGRKHRRPSKRRASQKGGYWSQVISTAVVPLSLFALNQHFAKRSKRHSRKVMNNTRRRR